jgi:hypothetical protein
MKEMSDEEISLFIGPSACGEVPEVQPEEESSGACDSVQPTENDKSCEIHLPSDSVQPTENDKSCEIHLPSDSVQPTENKKSCEIHLPSDSVQPTENDKSCEIHLPSDSVQPTENDKSCEIHLPSDSVQLTENSKSCEIYPPYDGKEMVKDILQNCRYPEHPPAPERATSLPSVICPDTSTCHACHEALPKPSLVTEKAAIFDIETKHEGICQLFFLHGIDRILMQYI